MKAEAPDVHYCGKVELIRFQPTCLGFGIWINTVPNTEFMLYGAKILLDGVEVSGTDLVVAAAKSFLWVSFIRKQDAYIQIQKIEFATKQPYPNQCSTPKVA